MTARGSNQELKGRRGYSLRSVLEAELVDDGAVLREPPAPRADLGASKRGMRLVPLDDELFEAAGAQQPHMHCTCMGLEQAKQPLI